MSDAAGDARRARFALNISAELYLRYYQGRARAVVVKDFNGRNLQMPASVLQRFVTCDGVQGVFEIEFDDKHRFVAIRRIDCRLERI